MPWYVLFGNFENKTKIKPQVREINFRVLNRSINEFLFNLYLIII